jgi:hypothetical protein
MLFIVLLHQNRRYAPLPSTAERAANSSPTSSPIRSDDQSSIQAPELNETICPRLRYLRKLQKRVRDRRLPEADKLVHKRSRAAISKRIWHGRCRLINLSRQSYMLR